MLNLKKGFTIIELIVVIAIIAVLAGIVIMNISSYTGKAKLQRVYTEANSIEKALNLFYTSYGDYPFGNRSLGACPGSGCSRTFYSYYADSSGTGTPYLTVNGVKHYLAEFYGSDWTNYNANFYANNAYFKVFLTDGDGDGKIGCGKISLMVSGASVADKYIICQDCTCGDATYSNTGIFIDK